MFRVKTTQRSALERRLDPSEGTASHVCIVCSYKQVVSGEGGFDDYAIVETRVNVASLQGAPVIKVTTSPSCQVTICIRQFPGDGGEAQSENAQTKTSSNSVLCSILQKSETLRNTQRLVLPLPGSHVRSIQNDHNDQILSEKKIFSHIPTSCRQIRLESR